jgi:hypothetical protein
MNYDNNNCLIPSATVQDHDDSPQVQKALNKWKNSCKKTTLPSPEKHNYWKVQSHCSRL